MNPDKHMIEEWLDMLLKRHKKKEKKKEEDNV